MNLISSRLGFEQRGQTEPTGLLQTSHPHAQAPSNSHAHTHTCTSYMELSPPQYSPRALVGQEEPEDSPHRPSPQLGLVAPADLPHPGKKDKKESKLIASERAVPRPCGPGSSSMEEVCGVVWRRCQEQTYW